MRFYLGFSKRIPLKWILIAIGAILAFFGITSQAHALTLADLQFKQAFNLGNTHVLDIGNGISTNKWTFTNSFTNSDNYQYFVIPFSYGSSSSNAVTSNFLNSITVTLNSNGNWLMCQVENGYIICPLQNGLTYTALDIAIPANAVGGYTKISFNSPFGYFYNMGGSTQTIIDNNNQNTQQIIDSQNNINSSINNSQVDTSSTSGGGFFDNFSVDDSRGFSSIITAPLQFLRDLLTSNSSCSPLSFNIDMQDDNIRVSNTGLSLPCGEVLWNRVPQAIELIWVTLVWGLVGYRLLLDMVKFINNSLNPEYSKEYFLDL